MTVFQVLRHPNQAAATFGHRTTWYTRQIEKRGDRMSIDVALCLVTMSMERNPERIPQSHDGGRISYRCTRLTAHVLQFCTDRRCKYSTFCRSFFVEVQQKGGEFCLFDLLQDVPQYENHHNSYLYLNRDNLKNSNRSRRDLTTWEYEFD